MSVPPSPPRAICVHGHFYQPPRENPWLDYLEVEDGAAPFHDWNARITAECYGPNCASRILDAQKRIRAVTNNFSHISFDVGPTLLSWMAAHAPEVYAQILEADRLSRETRGGHGNALAQAYNHTILPLDTRRDKVTQIRWGIADFRHRFGRDPEGMWLPETAVDLETLALLAEHGIAFTILALSLAVLMRIFSGSLRNADVTRDQAQAVALAQSLLASAGVEATLVPGESTGVLDDKFRWLLRVSPFVQEPRPGETEAVRSPLPLDLWEVAVRVGWGGDSRLPERALTLTTLRVQPATTP